MEPNTTPNPMLQPPQQDPPSPAITPTSSPMQQPNQPTPPTSEATFVPPAQQTTATASSVQPQGETFIDPTHAQAVTTPKSPRRKLVAVLAIVLVVLGSAGLGGAILLHKKPPVQNASATPQQNTTQDVIKLTDSTKLSAEPVLVVPSSIDGWTPDSKATADSPGLIHTTGCKMYYSRNVARKTDGIGDDKATEATIAADIERLKTGGKTTSEITYGTSNVAITNSNKKLEFRTATFEYADQMFDIIVSARRIDGYLIGMRFYCQRGAFSTDLNQKLLEKLSVTLKESS